LADLESRDLAAKAPRGAAVASSTAIPKPSAPVHIALAACCSVLLAFWLIASPAGALRNSASLLLGILLLMAIFQLPAVYWHHRGSAERRDAALMLPWALLLSVLMAQMARTASTFHFPLRDALWQALDQHLGISVPAMMAWAARHPFLHSALTHAYALSESFLVVAIFLPALAGKREAAERFFVANAAGFIIALPIVVFFPAMGPWVGWHFAPDTMQFICQQSIAKLRSGAVGGDLFGGTICLPSFHTFWAITSAHAMWPFRLLRYPAILLAALILVSTMTTGWHYGVDVISGSMLAALSTWIATMIVRMGRRPAQA
jgi:PAP2 superfamily